MGCDPVTFVASFDYVDEGISQIARNFFMLDQEVLSATMGGLGVDILSNLSIPANIALGML
jgi:hypothetical protein